MAEFPHSHYFDYAASAPPWPESLDSYVKVSEAFYANPSSQHILGKEAKKEFMELKKEFCDQLQFFDGRLLLCASGTEANNVVIEGHLKSFPDGRLLIAEDVHDSIWYATKKYPKYVDVIGIDSSGQLPIHKFEELLTESISLVCLSHACNETGIIHPIKELTDTCFRKQVKILIDGAQSVGHLPLELNDIPFTYFTFSGHKFGGVRSTGGLLFRDDQFESLISGGGQEWDLRAGTENVAGLSSMVAALHKSIAHQIDEMDRLKTLKESMISKLKTLPYVLVNSNDNGIHGLLSVSIPGRNGKELVSALSMSGFSVSTGSACHDNQMEPPRIILAMGRNEKEALGTIRISMGPANTVESVNELMEILMDLIR